MKTDIAAAALALGLMIAGSLAIGTSAHAQGLSPELIAKAETHFRAADKAASGSLDPAGFKAFIDLNAAAKIGRAPQIVSRNAYGRAFAAVDANKDGLVTWAEYMAAQGR